MRAQHQSQCDVCQQIEQIRQGSHPRFVSELKTGFVVMGPNQRYPGYCVLLCKIKEASELSDLPPEFRADFLADMARMAEAIQSVTDCYKLNYEALGNVCHHLHWHVFPRYADDPERLKPIWMVDEVIPYDEATHGSIRREIGEALG